MARPSLEWYVRAQHLLPGRAYRVDLTVDGRDIYSVGHGRADGAGILTAHGVLVRFTDQYCISTPTEAQPLAGAHQIAFAVKSDGAGSGAASAGSPLTDPARELPCDGNGDGNFEYWLVTPRPILLGPAAAP
jgi:hypothetical protein